MKKLLMIGLIVTAIGYFGFAHKTEAQIVTGPIFNAYTDTNGVGNEKDFVRVLNDDNTTVNTKEICSGNGRLWMYVHNGQASANNDDTSRPGAYDGVGVARDTRVKLSLPGTYSNSTTATGTISASNAATVNDTAYVTCGSKKVKVEFVAVESVKTTSTTGAYTLTGDITSANGALLSFDGNSGVVPGCWEYRALITIKIRVVEEPPKPTPQSLVCSGMTTPIITDRAKRTVSVGVQNAVATGGATISGYRIDWGDGTSTNAQNGTHSYTSDGQKTITGYVLGTVDGKTVTVTSDACKKTVKFEPITNEKALFCDGVKIDKLGGRKIRATATASTVNGATISGYSFNFNGEKVVAVNTSATTASSEYEFATDGTKRVVVTVSGTAPSVNCEASVQLTSETPSELPNTGAGGVAALFAAVSVVAGVGYRFWAARRLS